MANFFKSLFKVSDTITALKQPITYSAEEIQGSLVAQSILFMQEIKNEMSELQIPKDIENEYNLLTSLNFTNSANLSKINEIKNMVHKHNSARNYNILALKFMEGIYKFFPKSCLLIKYSDFEQLLNKYNLVCGELQDYTGAIPLDKLKEINYVKKTLQEKVLSVERIFKTQLDKTDNVNNIISYERFCDRFMISYLKYPTLYKNFKLLYKVNKLRKNNWTSEEINSLKRFPFVVKEGDYAIKQIGSQSKVKHFAYMPPAELNAPTYLFIAAPLQEMKTPFEIIDSRIPEDPFICSCTEFGVLVFSKWGNEANDQLFDRYNELKDFILNETKKIEIQ